MRLAPVLALGALVVFSAAANASDPIIYSQAFDGTGNAYSSQNDPNGFGPFAKVYDNFTLTGNYDITDVHWTGEYFNPPTAGTTTDVLIEIYADDGSGAPGSLLFSESGFGNANEVPIGNFGGFPTFTYSVDLSSAFTASAGTQYWLAIQPTVGFPPQWGWSSGTGGDGVFYQDFFGSQSAQPGDMAFELSGTPSIVAVPEPGEVATGILVAGTVVGLILRRRKA